MTGPRQPFALLLAFLAVALGLAGGVAVHVREQVLDRRAFADGALDALSRPPVEAVVVDEVTDRLLERVPAQLAPRPTVHAAIQDVVRTRDFRRTFRRSAAQANRVLFDGSADSAALKLDAVTAAMAGVDPRLAQLLPQQTSLRLLTLRRDSLGVGTVQIADGIEATARWAPPLALVALVAALLLAADRRRLLRATGVMTAVAGGLLLLATLLGRGTVRTRVDASAAISPAQARDAAGAVWDVYAGDLRTWALVAIGAGLVLAAATFAGGRRA